MWRLISKSTCMSWDHKLLLDMSWHCMYFLRRKKGVGSIGYYAQNFFVFMSPNLFPGRHSSCFKSQCGCLNWSKTSSRVLEVFLAGSQGIKVEGAASVQNVKSSVAPFGLEVMWHGPCPMRCNFCVSITEVTHQTHEIWDVQLRNCQVLVDSNAEQNTDAD